MPNYRGEGVAIVLSGVVLQAWKAEGCQWKWVSPCLITAKLLFGTQWLHVVSCYAPTYAQPRHVKNEFFDTLRGTLLSIPEKDLYVVVGDFNARVGSGSGTEDEDWRQVRGIHGIGQLNDAGDELLSFFSLFGSPHFQHAVSQEGHPQGNVAASTVATVALHQLRRN